MSENELISGILSRDRKALFLFYQKYTPDLKRYVITKIGNQEDADEIIQDTLYAFLDAIRDYTGKSKLATYLYAICNHKIVDFYRRKKIKTAIFSQAPQLETLISPLLGPEEQMDVNIIRAKVHRALSKLLPRYQKILLFKYADGQTMEAIAKKLMVTSKSVECALFRAKKAFVEAFVSN
jgi:RNA polymerase sigma-70 factor, ECF subfamily